MKPSIIATEDASTLDGSPITSGAFYAFRKVYYLQKKGYNITFDLKGIFKNSDIIYYNYFQECLKYINK